MTVTLVKKENTFSDAWIEYLEQHQVNYVCIDPYASNCIDEIKKTDCFLWHFDHFDYRDSICAKGIIYALENKIPAFPNLQEAFFFDDKLTQKYLLDSLEIKAPNSFVCFDEKQALDYIDKCSFPIVAKLRRGAGSGNVWKLNNIAEGKKFIRQSFEKGFSIFNSDLYLKRRLIKVDKQKEGFKGKLKALRGKFKNIQEAAIQNREKGYVLFQDYIENEGFDIRVVVINQNKAFSARRDAQEGDWRSSGSGIASYPNEKIDPVYIEEAFDIAKKLQTRCVAIDFVKDKNTNELFTVEISVFYAFYSMKPAKGYWTENLKWVEDDRDPQFFLINELVRFVS